jgi:hypothetical protein
LRVNGSHDDHTVIGFEGNPQIIDLMGVHPKYMTTGFHPF